MVSVTVTDQRCKFWSGPIMVLEQIANLSLVVIRVLGSSPSRSAKWFAPIDKLAKSSLSKGEVLSVRIRVGVPKLL